MTIGEAFASPIFLENDFSIETYLYERRMEEFNYLIQIAGC